MNPLLDALAQAAPGCPLLTQADEMAPYLHDWRGLFRGQAACVARPASTADAAAVVRIAALHGAAIVPQGGNTGLAGGATPQGGRLQVLLSLDRMKAIRRLDRVGMTLEVEAGCVLQAAKDAATAAGRLLSISFAAQGSATVGGMVATNAGGINALRYGTVRQAVLGLEVVLPDGSVARRLHGLRKDNAGYDWKQWFIGSEGTLGVVTAAVLRLHPLARDRGVAFVALASPTDAVRLLERLQDEVGDALSAFELMSGASVQRAAALVGGRVPVQAAPWHVLVEMADSAPLPSGRLMAVLEDAMGEGDIADAAIAESLGQMTQFWALRENITEAEKHAGASAKHDIAVAVSDVPAFIDSATRTVAALSDALTVNAFGHLGDGNIHFNVLLGHSGVPAAVVNRAVHDTVDAYGGSIAAEHGIGQYRIDELQRLKPPAEIALMQRLKQALDPHRLMNPGKVLADHGDDPSCNDADS